MVLRFGRRFSNSFFFFTGTCSYLHTYDTGTEGGLGQEPTYIQKKKRKNKGEKKGISNPTTECVSQLHTIVQDGRGLGRYRRHVRSLTHFSFNTHPLLPHATGPTC